jgi:YVTN family beta-propeller protein
MSIDVSEIAVGMSPSAIVSYGNFVIVAGTATKTINVINVANGTPSIVKTFNSTTPGSSTQALLMTPAGYLIQSWEDQPNLDIYDANNNYALVTSFTPADPGGSGGNDIVYNSTNNCVYRIGTRHNTGCYNITTSTYTTIPLSGNAATRGVLSNNRLYVLLTDNSSIPKAIDVIDCSTNTLLFTAPVTSSVAIGTPIFIVSNNYAYIATDHLLKVSLTQASPSTTSVSTGLYPSWITSVGTNIYVANGGSNNVSIYDSTTATPTFIKNLSTGSSPYFMLASNAYVYVSNTGGNTITDIDSATNTVINTITLSYMPWAMTSVGTYLYVTEFANALVAQIGGSQLGGGGGGGPVPCFPAGTNILTASGYKKVESLAQGELVLTADGRQVPVKIYGKFIPATTTVTAPFRVSKGTFGLANDLVLSPDHAFQIRKGVWMIPKRAALMSERIEQISVGNSVTYYHLECPQYLRDNLVVDGTVVESYAGKQLIKGQGLTYTYNERLKGYTRTAATATAATAATATAATKFLTKA